MVRSVEGIYRNGRVELLEAAPTAEESKVIVTFLPTNGSIDLASRQISEEQAKNLRARLSAFADDWQRPDMDAYDAL